MNRILNLLLALLMLVGTCLAGITYTATSVTEYSGTNAAPSEKMTVRGYVSGDKAKVEFVESNSENMPPGAYLITLDGAKTILLVDPSQKRYVRYDVLNSLRSTAALMQRIGDLQFHSPVFQKLLEEDGGPIAGVPTRHFRFHSSYEASMTLPNSMRAMTSTTTQDQDLWVSPKLLDAALTEWLRSNAAVTGYEELDNIIRTQLKSVKGFALKEVSLTKNSASNGVTSIVRRQMEVTKLNSSASVPASTFAIPADYKEYEPQAEQSGEDEE
jgi:hypothetical protein